MPVNTLHAAVGSIQGNSFDRHDLLLRRRILTAVVIFDTGSVGIRGIKGVDF